MLGHRAAPVTLVEALGPAKVQPDAEAPRPERAQQSPDTAQAHEDAERDRSRPDDQNAVEEVLRREREPPPEHDKGGEARCHRRQRGEGQGDPGPPPIPPQPEGSGEQREDQAGGDEDGRGVDQESLAMPSMAKVMVTSVPRLSL